MNTSHSFRSLLAAAAIGFTGLAAHAQVDPLSNEPIVPVSDPGAGLLGRTYGTLTYGYVDLDDVSTHADDYTFQLSQPLSPGFDGFLKYDYLRSGNFGGAHFSENNLLAGLRAFSTRYAWGRPYVEAGAGYSWTRYAGNKDNSFLWEAAVGAEFTVAPRTTVTPYVQYVDTPDLSRNGTWNFGVRGNYWVTPEWAITAGVERNDDQDNTFTVGTNFNF